VNAPLKYFALFSFIIKMFNFFFLNKGSLFLGNVFCLIVGNRTVCLWFHVAASGSRMMCRVVVSSVIIITTIFFKVQQQANDE
jgi:hypothetical protein